MLTAELAIVKLGHIEIEGLLLSNGIYGISSKQICVLLLDSDIKSRYKDRLTKLCETKVGKKLIPHGLEFDEKVKLLDPSIKGTPYRDVISLPCFEKLLRVADKLGNDKASELVDDLVGLSLHQLFSDAFGRKFEADDRQAWLKQRQQGKITRRTLTDAIKDYIQRNEVAGDSAKWLYCQVTEATYSQ